MRGRWMAGPWILLFAVAVVASLVGPPAPVAPSGQLERAASTVQTDAASADPSSPADPSTVAPAIRDRTLPTGWRSSADMAWTTSGDPVGFHVLAADARSGYTWRTVATLAEPGFDTDRWIGNACLTGSGRRAVVVYAPRQFTNRPQLFDRGAFAAVVDLQTGSVRKLGVGSTLAYFNPGCGAGETAVLTQAAQDLGKTRLHWLDTVSGKVTQRAELVGQATSAVPVGDRIVAAYPPGLVQIDPGGHQSDLAVTDGLPFHVHPDRAGGVVFLQQRGDDAVVRHAQGTQVTDLARGRLTRTGLAAGTGGRVFLTGEVTSVDALPAAVSRVKAPVEAEISSQGQLALRHVDARAGDPADAHLLPTSAQIRPVRLTAAVLSTGKAVGFTVTPGFRPAPATTAGGLVAGPGSPSNGVGIQAVGTEPYDANRTCAVPRNDPAALVYQPHWHQVEWAADLAVQNALTLTRPANWKASGLPAWSPQGMFLPVPLSGGGQVPAQILLGVLTQESNLWQASRHTVEGLTGNPLIGNFYGLGSSDPWAIHWADADCGYGIGQVTDNMRLADTALTANQKRAIALDYATNIAAALRILQQKWNQTRQAGIIINDGDPRWPENWWAAVWAYNTGLQPDANNGNTTGCTPSSTCTDNAGRWGLGYTNNLANGSYPRNREPFLATSPDDARNPQRWSYPEKVMGWAAFPITKVELTDPESWQPGFAQAWWNTETDRYESVRPPLNLFCTAAISCDMSHTANGKPEGCTLPNFHCWWHSPATWKVDCASRCGHAAAVYHPGDPEPAGREGTNYPPECGLGPLPGNAIIVDDTTVAPVRSCSRPNLSGTFGFWFAQDSTGSYRSKIDFHQIGAGWGDHFWFSHTYGPGHPDQEARGIWTPNLPGVGWYRVVAHLPDHGAHTRTARYQVRLADGSVRLRVVNQFNQDRRGTWAHIGSFRLGPGSNVMLSNVYPKGDGDWDVAYDAMAFIPLPSKPYSYVALGDSYSAGEGNPPYDTDGAFKLNDSEDKCHRAPLAYSRTVKHNGVAIAAHSAGTEPYEFQHLACSGATTVGLTDAAVDEPGENAGENSQWRSEIWQFGEEQQLERGFLDADTDLVTITIGGNDVGYSTVFQACATKTPNCLSDSYYLTRGNGQVDPSPLRTYEPHIIDLAANKLRDTYLKIVQLAPNARVVVLGYARFFPLRDERALACPLSYGLLTSEEIDWFNDMTNRLDDRTAEVVVAMQSLGYNIRYLSVNNAFQGHRLCEEDSGAVPYLYDVDLSDIVLGGMEGWFHPNHDGQRAYATLAQRGKELP